MKTRKTQQGASKVGPIKETGKKTEKIEVKKSPEEELISFVNACHSAGDDYFKKFKNLWDDIEGQIRCKHPDEWDKKEDWQTKVFIPQQAKTSETAQSYLDKMLFGQKKFFNITGEGDRDKDQEGAIEDLFSEVFDNGSFAVENDFVLNEACSGPGTSFIKLLVDPKRRGINFYWRSAYNVRVDPKCGHKLENARFIIDEYKKSISDMISEVERGDSLYGKDKIQALVKAGEICGLSKTEEGLTRIKSFDGTEVTIANEYSEVNLVEFWGQAKKTDKNKDGKDIYTYEERIITVANGTTILRDVPNEYGFKPFFSCRIKPRKYDFYGLGFLSNTVDLQELTNSMICLGFDSLKMCSMDIALLDETKVKDPASIEYRPMAIWKLKGNPNEAVKLGRQGISALSDIMRGLSVLDQFQQEATGVLRQIQGAPDLAGGGGSETLGEYQAKLSMIDNRFLKHARFIERDYIEPILKGMFMILFNPKFFNQPAIDRIIEPKEVDILAPNPNNPSGPQVPTGQKQRVPRINFAQISSQGPTNYNFKAVGATQFSKSIETLQKLKELLVMVVKTPQLMIISKVEAIYKRVLQAAEIQDYEDLIKSNDEIKAIMNQIYGGQPSGPGGPGPGIPPGTGAPAGTMPGLAGGGME